MLQNITGLSLGTIFNESLVDALHLRETSFTVPSTTKNGAIPINATASGWDVDMGIFGA